MANKCEANNQSFQLVYGQSKRRHIHKHTRKPLTQWTCHLFWTLYLLPFHFLTLCQKGFAKQNERKTLSVLFNAVAYGARTYGLAFVILKVELFFDMNFAVVIWKRILGNFFFRNDNQLIFTFCLTFYAIKMRSKIYTFVAIRLENSCYGGKVDFLQKLKTKHWNWK